MVKVKIMGFHQPPSTILLMAPHTQTTPPNFTRHIKRCAKYVEMITWKRLVQFIGQKELFKKS